MRLGLAIPFALLCTLVMVGFVFGIDSMRLRFVHAQETAVLREELYRARDAAERSNRCAYPEQEGDR